MAFPSLFRVNSARGFPDREQFTRSGAYLTDSHAKCRASDSRKVTLHAITFFSGSHGRPSIPLNYRTTQERGALTSANPQEKSDRARIRGRKKKRRGTRDVARPSCSSDNCIHKGRSFRSVGNKGKDQGRNKSGEGLLMRDTDHECSARRKRRKYGESGGNNIARIFCSSFPGKLGDESVSFSAVARRVQPIAWRRGCSFYRSQDWSCLELSF